MVKVITKTDSEIVKKCLKDSSHFEELIKRYEKKLMRYILRISDVGSETAMDILQEVFIKVYENLNDFDDQFLFSSWIYRITHNCVMSHFKKTKNRPFVMSINDDTVDDLINLIPGELNIPEEMDKKQLCRSVRVAVMELPGKYREVLVLHYLEDKSYKEISDILKKSINSVSVLINRAKQKLKVKLKYLNK
jgi:RNA polymerase sigma-70 factor, ECF subfamily